MAMKKVDPYEESAIVKEASEYSNACSEVNSSPRMMVKVRDRMLFDRLLFMISWWAHVTEIPDDKRIRVFSSGTCRGLNGVIIIGGHLCPSSMFGEVLL